MSRHPFSDLLRSYFPRFKKVVIDPRRFMAVPAGVSVSGLAPGVAREIGLSAAGPVHLRGGFGPPAPQGAPADLPEQGYVLVWDETPRVWGRDYAGLYYGGVTLAQLLQLAREAGLRRIPAFRLIDWPDMPRRGVVVDYGRGLSFHLGWAQRFIRRLAAFKINEFHFYFENRLEMNSIPLFAPDDAATQADMRRLIAWARGHAVTIVPHANMLAHSEELLRTQRYAHLREERHVEDAYMCCPSHPQTRSLLRREIREIARLFDSPIVHVGCDEPADLGACPRCAKRLERIGAQGIYLEHLQFLKTELARHGKRLAFWDDALLEALKQPGQAHAADLIRALQGTVPFDWYYGGSRPESMRLLKCHGFDEFYVTADSGGWAHLYADYSRAMTNALAFLKDGHEAGAGGAVITIWEPHRGHRADAHLAQVGQFGAAAWDRRPVADGPFLRHFGRLVFGPRSDDFADLVAALTRWTTAELNAAIPPGARGGDATRQWRYQVYWASDPLYAWKALRGQAAGAARFFRRAAAGVHRAVAAARRRAVRNGELFDAFETVWLCLEAAGVRLEAGEALRRAYEDMDRAPVGRRGPFLRRCLAALDRVRRDLRRHAASERRFIRRTGGDCLALDCLADVDQRLAQWQRRLRQAARQRRLPALELLLSLRDYRDPYPTTLRRFDTNKTLQGSRPGL